MCCTGMDIRGKQDVTQHTIGVSQVPSRGMSRMQWNGVSKALDFGVGSVWGLMQAPCKPCGLRQIP